MLLERQVARVLGEPNFPVGGAAHHGPVHREPVCLREGERLQNLTVFGV